jgi:hypothetical protein
MWPTGNYTQTVGFFWRRIAADNGISRVKTHPELTT